MDWNNFIKRNLEPVSVYKPGLREEQICEIAQTDRIYKLSSNESPLPPFASSLTAMQAALVSLNEYPDGSTYQLTQALATRYNIPPEQIVTGNGSNELVDDIAQTCLEPGDNAVYCWPSFVVYRSSTQINGAESRELALTDKGSYDLDAILDAIDEHTKLVIVCTPNNPTGGIVTNTKFARFIENVPQDVLVVVDAAYQEFVDDPASVDPLAYFDGIRPLVVLRTFSKMYSLAGARCGYGFAPVQLIEAINKVREPFNVNSIAQAGARACLFDTEELQRRRALNREGRRRLSECFAQLGLDYIPSEANFVWVKVPDADATFQALLKQGIIVRSFPGINGLRVGVGDEEGVNATIAAFRALFAL